MTTVHDVMKQVDPAMLDAVEAMVVSYMGHRRHETEEQTRSAINADPALAQSHQRKVQRAAIALMAVAFDLRAAPSSPSKPAATGGV